MALIPMEYDGGVIVNIQTITSTGEKSIGEDVVAPTQISGYTPICIVGYHELSEVRTYYYNMYYSPTTGRLDIGWATINGLSVNNHKVDVYVLYKKN